jgi:hypothetical protein
MDRIKLINSLLYLKYGKRTAKHYQRNVITHIISKKYCHIVSCLKDSMIYDFIDEFLYKYYKKREIKYNLKKYFNYYKNYLKFFCYPTFREFPINKIIKYHGEKKAEIYYQKHYGNEEKKKKPKEFKKIFSDTVNEKINDITDNSNTSSISNQLNQSSFRLLSRNYNFEDFDNKSILNLLDEINGISKSLSNKINITQENKVKKYNNKNFQKPKRNFEKIQIYSMDITPKINKLIDDIPKELELKNQEDNNKNKNINNITINDNDNIYNNNIINMSNINNNYRKNLSKLNSLNKYNFQSIKIKIKEKPNHKKNILSTQLSNKINLTEENNSIKKNSIKILIDSSNSNNCQNKNIISITENKPIGIISLKSKFQINTKIPNFNSSKIKNTSLFNFEQQQFLLNKGKSHKYKGSFNVSSRNNQHIYSYTQTFSPQITNRPNSKFLINNKKICGIKLYKLPKLHK